MKSERHRSGSLGHHQIALLATLFVYVAPLSDLYMCFLLPPVALPVRPPTPPLLHRSSSPSERTAVGNFCTNASCRGGKQGVRDLRQPFLHCKILSVHFNSQCTNGTCATFTPVAFFCFAFIFQDQDLAVTVVTLTLGGIDSHVKPLAML